METVNSAPIRMDPLLDKLERVLDLRMQQHALTASNLANADTPGYKAKMVDFSHVLDEAMGEQGSKDLTRTDPRHQGPMGHALDNPSVVEIEAPPWSVDGNSVLPERETARLQTNALMYDAVAQGMAQKLNLLRYVVSDGRV